MPFRNRSTLQAWLDEFVGSGPTLSDTLRVVELDGVDGELTGLVALQLEHSATRAYIEPQVDGGSARWIVTFEPREEAVEMDADSVAALGRDLLALADLVRYLTEKASAFLADRSSE